MQSLTILHTNDIHGRIPGLARIATVVRNIRRERRDTPVVYFDIGDSEEASVRLSNLTKGSAMHRLLSAAGCDAAAVGNAALMRYGPDVLAAQAAEATYPFLLSNIRLADGTPLAGTQSTAILAFGELRLGLIGLSSPMFGSYENFFGLQVLPEAPLVAELAAKLRADGAHAVMVLPGSCCRPGACDAGSRRGPVDHRRSFPHLAPRWRVGG